MVGLSITTAEILNETLNPHNYPIDLKHIKKVPSWDRPSPDQNRPEIIHIGPGWPRLEQIAQSLKR